MKNKIEKQEISSSSDENEVLSKNNKLQTDKKPNFFVRVWRSLVRLWHYYTTYEKIWLLTLCTLGILFAILYPEDPNELVWLRVVEIIAIIGGCSCELLLSKQSRWAFIVSFFLYDLTQTIVYFANGLYISALFEIIFWMPMLFISFYVWSKHADQKDTVLTSVKKINIKRDLAIFLGVLAVSVIVGAIFSSISFIAEGLSDYWYLDALANAFSVCNGLFLLMRYQEQWLPWLGVTLVEAVLWILCDQPIMLVLSLGYLTNSIYGLVKWIKYTRANPEIADEAPELFHKHKKANNKILACNSANATSDEIAEINNNAQVISESEAKINTNNVTNLENSADEQVNHNDEETNNNESTEVINETTDNDNENTDNDTNNNTPLSN